jgi:RNA polymerase sigma-70 factor (ECF subfamily)
VLREELDALVARAQEGDVRAFEALVAAHLPQVRRFARAFASEGADADDLAQEALLRVYRNLRSFRYQAAFSSWLYALVRNTFLVSVPKTPSR